MESRARLILVDAGLRCPAVNKPVVDAFGQFVALPDLSYPDLRIAIEYDGDLHRTDARIWRKDKARREALEALGWRVITLTADDVLHHPDRLVHLVATAIRTAAAR
jgi:very-short-patch-repair endonuclease